MRLLICYILLFSASVSLAQDLKYTASEPVDISTNGYDRLLVMQNGNTVLFHFENRKGIIVKVFDAGRKEIATHKELCKIADINTFNVAALKGVYDVNNEAVLFIEQDIDNRKTLVRLRFNSTTGKLIAEDKVVQSEGFNKPTHTGLLQSEVDGRYFLVCMKEKKGFIEKEMHMNVYNAAHEVEKTIPINIEQKGYDDVTLNRAVIDKNGGVIASVVLTKIIRYPTLNERELVVCYLPPGGDKFIYNRVKLPQVADFDMRSTYNPFANSINLLLTLHFFDEVTNAKGTSTTALSEHILMIMDEGATTAGFVKLANHKVRNYIAREIDTNQFLSTSVMKMYTNQYGLTTVVCDGYTKHVANIGMNNVTGLRRNISFTQLDDKGSEIFGIAVPISRLKTFNDYPAVFGTNSEINLGNKDCFNTKSNFYVAFNEVEKNFNLKLAQQHDSIYNVEFTNAVYYKLNRKKEITEAYLLGQPVEGEYKHIYPGSSFYDEKNNLYAVLYRHKKGEKFTTHVAWVNVD